MLTVEETKLIQLLAVIEQTDASGREFLSIGDITTRRSARQLCDLLAGMHAIVEGCIATAKDTRGQNVLVDQPPS